MPRGPSLRLLVAIAGVAIAGGGGARAATEQIVYTFTGGSDGANPYSGLIVAGGTLYGDTSYGGAGGGTVFSVNRASGAEHVLHAFQVGANGAPDAMNPTAALIDVGGNLIGPGGDGGRGGSCGGFGCGAVFSVNAGNGAESLLYSFRGGKTDGGNPSGSLIDVGGTLYGTTLFGGGPTCSLGANNCGTVYALNPATGVETVLYFFTGGSDGAQPDANLLNIGNVLYGTASLGGAFGAGAIFAFNLATHAETVLYSFSGGNDGAVPACGLVAFHGLLYGTTKFAGAAGLGTVFSINPGTHAFTLVHGFVGGADGGAPQAGLTVLGTTLYGTTLVGGSTGSGTVYEIAPATGAETVVYSFQGMDGHDGAGPYAPLLKVGGTLYGTTVDGGNFNAGVVFAVTP